MPDEALYAFGLRTDQINMALLNALAQEFDVLDFSKVDAVFTHTVIADLGTDDDVLRQHKLPFGLQLRDEETTVYLEA